MQERKSLVGRRESIITATTDLGGRLAGAADALEHELPVLRGNEKVALADLGLLGRHEDAQPGEPRAQARLAVVRRRGLALVHPVVLQLHREDAQREVACKQHAERGCALAVSSVLQG